MATDRRDMTVRVVPVGSDEAGESRVAGTAAERVALVGRLSEEVWVRTHRPLPAYTRATMPVHLTTLRALPHRG